MRRLALLVAAAAALGLAGGAAGYRSGAVAQPPGTMVIGPSTLVTGSLQNHPTCGSQGCTFIQFSGTAADPVYAAPVDGTIVAWRIASDSANNKVTLRILRPAGGGKYSAVASSATVSTSGSQFGPDQFSTSIAVKAGDIIGLDNANSALIFKTGVLGAFPELWTPPLTNGGSPSAPTAPVGTTVNGYQLQIDAYLQPAPTTTSTTTTTTTTTTTPTTTTVNPGTTSLSLAHVSVTTRWHNSRLRGKVGFSFTVAGATHVTAEIRRGASIKAKRNITTTRGGTFPETLSLSPRTAPGSYVLRLVARTESQNPVERESPVVLEAPPEGVVDTATISIARGGPAAASVKSPQKSLWVRFHFLALPKSSTVRIVWRTPSLKFVGAVTKPAAAALDSSLASTAPLARGRWYAVLSVNGVVVKRVGVRIE